MLKLRIMLASRSQHQHKLNGLFSNMTRHEVRTLNSSLNNSMLLAFWRNPWRHRQGEGFGSASQTCSARQCHLHAFSTWYFLAALMLFPEAAEQAYWLSN